VKTSVVNVTVKAMQSKHDINSENYQHGQYPLNKQIKLHTDVKRADYEYLWSGNGAFISNATLSYLEGFLEPGSYIFEADLNGCKAQSDGITLKFKKAAEYPLIYAQGQIVWYFACCNDSAAQYKYHYNGNVITGANKYV
jgi:hypothetical protein